MSKQNSTTKNANKNTIRLVKVFDSYDVGFGTLPEEWVVKGLEKNYLEEHSISVIKEGDEYLAESYYFMSVTDFYRDYMAYGKTPEEAANKVLSNYDLKLGMKVIR
tara:strand:- start:438 stop:755 length:318 start_codon:yes stop_codon:yes gene_type:complete